MPVPRDTTMLKPDSRKVLIAMAEAELEPTELARQQAYRGISSIRYGADFIPSRNISEQ